MSVIKKAVDCETMIDVRAGVDATDRALIQLLDDRFRYMEAAARIKPTREAVRDEARKTQVIENAKALAKTHNIPVELTEELWEILVEGSIAFETETWDKTR